MMVFFEELKRSQEAKRRRDSEELYQNMDKKGAQTFLNGCFSGLF